MRKRAVAASVFASLGILTVGWQIGAATAAPAISTSGGSGSGSASGTPSGSASSGTTSTGTGSASSSAAPAAPAPTTASGVKDGSYTGTSEQTPFGNVQVKVTIAGGKITDVKALRLTDNGQRSVQISNYAAPILRQEVLASQSAHVSNVNGATYTTDGYLSSVQSALDAAKA